MSLTFHKLVSKLNFEVCNPHDKRNVLGPHIRRNHSHWYTLERKHHSVSDHSLHYMSMYLEPYNFLCHMVDRKLAHRICPFYPKYSLVCKRKYYLCIHHSHNLNMNRNFSHCFFSPFINYSYLNLTNGTCWHTKIGQILNMVRVTNALIRRKTYSVDTFGRANWVTFSQNMSVTLITLTTHCDSAQRRI